MTTKPKKPATPPAADAFAHQGDAHWGKGGRYIVNPDTGKREPAPADQETAKPKEL